MRTYDVPSSFSPAEPAAALAFSLRASIATRSTSKRLRLAALARSALARGSRKFRANPSFTLISSPRPPQPSSRSSRMTFICASPLLHDVGEQGQEARALDGLGQFALLLGRDRGDPRRHDLAALGDVALQELHVLVVDLRGVGAGERAHLAATEEGAAGATGSAGGGRSVLRFDGGFVGHQKAPSLAGKSSRRSRSRSRRARIGESSSSSSSTRTVR